MVTRDLSTTMLKGRQGWRTGFLSNSGFPIKELLYKRNENNHSTEHNSAYPFDGTSRENDHELCELTENFILKENVVDAVEQLLEEGIQRDRQKFVDDILLCHDMMLTVEQMKEELDIPLDIAVFIADVIKDAMIP